MIVPANREAEKIETMQYCEALVVAALMVEVVSLTWMSEGGRRYSGHDAPHLTPCAGSYVGLDPAPSMHQPLCSEKAAGQSPAPVPQQATEAGDAFDIYSLGRGCQRDFCF